MSTSKRPARPSDRLAWRDQLSAELESTANQATGSVQPVLSKMLALIRNANPNGVLDKKLFQDLQDAFARYAQDTAAAATPPLVTECLEWIQLCFIAPLQASGSSGAVAKKAPAVVPGVTPEAAKAPPLAESKKSGSDGFDSSSAARARALSGKAPAEASPEQKQQQELETIKNWMMNPGLGKVKG